ncbi:hypothetical protein T492DRAFT_835393 [Pavlovales sp. CCMP2436]|nr:hypothetical protein T492DRAFT_835393 [Pavlovales sp. CCMP2436]
MCIQSDLDLILSINAGGMARRGAKSDLFGEYNYGDIRVIDHFNGKFRIEGDLIDPETNNVYPFLHLEATEKRLHTIAESVDAYCEDELIAMCPTPPVLLRLMELQMKKKGKK